MNFRSPVTFAEALAPMAVRLKPVKKNARRESMIRTVKTILGITALAFILGLQPAAYAQDSMHEKHAMQEKDTMHTQDTGAKTLSTGTFHGKVHKTSGRATVYQQKDGTLLLRLTGFKTSNGPDVHVILVASKDATDDANFLKSNIERVELGKLKGNEGDQNYSIPAGTDLSKFQTVSIYCERFDANFGAAPLEKF
jgi:pentapeptide MXKDX repeat protein